MILVLEVGALRSRQRLAGRRNAETLAVGAKHL